MLPFEHIILSVLANTIGLCSVLLMKTAPPRLVLYVCLASMIAILVPWTSFGERVEGLIPVDQLIAIDVVNLVSNKTTAFFLGVQSASVAVGIVWLVVGVFWVITTVLRSVRTTKKWRKTAFNGDSLATYAHTSLTKHLGRSHIRRLPNSSMVATTGLWHTEIWIGDQVRTDAQVKTALNHELCHVASHDQHTLFLIVIIERLLWWNPLIWLLGHHARRSMEYDCDSRCKSLIGEREYRRSLAQLFLVDRPPTTALEIPFGIKSDVVNRMENLEMNPKFKLRHLLTLGCASVLLAAAGAKAASENPPESRPTLIECHEFLPENVQYDLQIISDIDTREGKKNVLTVGLSSTKNSEPEAHELPVGSERFMQCIQGVLGVGDNEGWPGT